MTVKVKILAESSAVSTTGWAGVVFNTSGGSNLVGARIGEFSGQAFEGSLEGSNAVLKVTAASIGGTLPSVGTPVMVYAQNSTKYTPVWEGVVIDE